MSWDDYGFVRDGCVPLSAYTSNPVGSIFISNSVIANTAVVGSILGNLTVIGGTGRYSFSVVNNPYFSLLGSTVRIKAPLTGGSYYLTVNAASLAGVVSQQFIVTVTGIQQAAIGAQFGGSLVFQTGISIDVPASLIGSAFGATPTFVAGLSVAGSRVSGIFGANPTFAGLITLGAPVGAVFGATPTFAGSLSTAVGTPIGASFGSTPTFSGSILVGADTWDYTAEYLLNF
jgi:hypothetical protein